MVVAGASRLHVYFSGEYMRAKVEVGAVKECMNAAIDLAITETRLLTVSLCIE